MRSRLRDTFTRALVAAALSLPAAALADHHEGKPAPGGAPPDMAAQMEAWMQTAAPGASHKLLDPFVGSWDATVKMWMAPGMDPQTSTGTCQNQWMLGGRYVHTTFQGDFMGMPFEGAGVTGYDNLKKKYTSLWMDNMSTYFSLMEGQSSADGKNFTYSGMVPDAMTGATKKVKEVIRMVSNDEHVMEWWEAGPDGKDMMTMEITYKRKKSM